MATLIQGKWIGASAKQAVLESKLVALRNVVTNFAATGSSADVSTSVLAAATTDVPQTALTALGIYTGAVADAADPLKVLIRSHGTDNGLDDGSGDEVYGVLSESAGVYTLSFKKSDGTAHSFGSSTPIDFYFVEVYNEFNKPVNAHLLTAIGGVIDATTADALTAHIGALTDAHDASAISFTPGTNEVAYGDNVQTAIVQLDTALGAMSTVHSNHYSWQGDPTVANYLKGIDDALGQVFTALGSAGYAKEGARVATTAALAATYSNGTFGVGATLTGTGNGALVVDGVTLSLDDRVLVKNQGTAAENGIYKVTAVGDGSSAFELTRTTDLDQYTDFARGVTITVKEGTINFRRQYFLADPVETVGTSAVTWASTTVDSLYVSESNFRLYKNAGDSNYVGFQLTQPTANRVIKVPDRDVDLAWVTKPVVEIKTLVGGDISAKYIDLANVIKSPGADTVQIVPVGGPEQEYGVEFTAANNGAAGVGRISWSGMGLDGMLEAGDKIIVRYVTVAS